MTIIFTVGKVQAQSYLNLQSGAVRDLAQIAAKAFIKGSGRKAVSKKRKVVSTLTPAKCGAP